MVKKQSDILLTSQGVMCVDFIRPSNTSTPDNSEPKFDFIYMLKFQITAELVQLMNELKVAVDRPDVKWEKYEDLHVTLVYARGATADQAADMAVALEHYRPVNIIVDSIGVFSTAEGGSTDCLHLKPVKDVGLATLQKQLCGIAEGHMLDISNYSTPEDWIPHITLAYFDSPYPQGLALNKAILLPGTYLEASSDYNTLYTTS